MTFDTHLPLNERLLRIDHIQARRYSKLNGIALEIATEGIVRHLKACDRMDVNPETSAVREIIDDALNGRRVFAETTEHPRAASIDLVFCFQEIAPHGRSLFLAKIYLKAYPKLTKTVSYVLTSGRHY